jgi:hypothetical protein
MYLSLKKICGTVSLRVGGKSYVSSLKTSLKTCVIRFSFLKSRGSSSSGKPEEFHEELREFFFREP